MKIVVVSPHHGDAACALALAIGTWVEAGHKVTVLTCFSRSEEAPYSDAGSVHANDRMSFVTAIRGREDELWRRQYGTALTLIDLNMKDGPLRLHRRPHEVFGLTLNAVDKWLLKIGKAVEGLNAGAVVLPLGLGGHIDHATVREASARLALTDLPCGFYEDMPYALSVESIDSEVGALELGLRTKLVSAFAGAASDVDEAVKRKRKAVVCFDSLIDNAEVDRIAQFCKLYEGRERLWVNVAWAASPLAEKA